MTMLNCAILDDYQDVALGAADWGRLPDGVRVDRFAKAFADLDASADALADYEIVVAMRERTVFDAALLERLPKLRLLITTGMRNASIDMAAAAARGVTVCGTRNSIGPAAELAWGLLLALKRNIPAEVANFRAAGAQWQTTVGGDLKQKVLGVVGLGKLGQIVARYGKAFDMEVIGWSKNNSPERCAELGIGYAPTLDDLLQRSDAVSLHVLLNGETKGMIGARELALMKRDAVIVNTSRGPLIDEAALVAALQERRIAGAATDVFDVEPLPAGHPFRSLPNLIATPHIGYVTAETYALFYGDAVEDIAAWMAGEAVRVLNA